MIGKNSRPPLPVRLIIISLFTVLLIASVPAKASEVNLVWDPSPSPEATGYNVYSGSVSGTYSQAVDVGNWTNCVMSGLEPGKTYYFAATAYSSTEESDYSNEVIYSVPGYAGSFTISASGGRGGSISPTGIATLSAGGSKTFTITPNSRYIVSAVQVDGSNIGAVPTYTFTNVSSNHTIRALFKKQRSK